MPTIRCIRHGQSASNAGEVTQYPDTIPLTKLGHSQAAMVASCFTGAPRLVVFSAFDRAVQTAMPLCEKYPDVPVAVWPVQEFTYLAPSRYIGTRRSDRGAAVSEYWYRLDPGHRDGPGAETFIEFWDRAEAFLDRCCNMRGHVVVFSHGQFLRGVMLRLISGPLGVEEAMIRFRAFRHAIAMPNAAMVLLHLSPRARRISPVLTEHLPGEMLSS
jgi:broad specificity phosphatase PhoE